MIQCHSMNLQFAEYHNGRGLVTVKAMDTAILESIDQIKKLGRNVRPTPSSIFQSELVKRGWTVEEPVPQTNLRLDGFHSSKVGIEIEMTDPQDLLRALIKLQLAYVRNKIDVGVIITYQDSFRGDNIPHMSNVKRWYDTLFMFLTFPLWLIGLG